MVQIRACLKFLKFGMGTTLITFQDKYFLYDGDKTIEEKGLTIGGYESAWLADLVMSYLLETVDQSLFDQLKYFGIYRDDGLAIFPGVQSANTINDWLVSFQLAVNEQTGNDYLKFTCLLYTSPSPRDQRGSRMPSSA